MTDNKHKGMTRKHMRNVKQNKRTKKAKHKGKKHSDVKKHAHKHDYKLKKHDDKIVMASYNMDGGSSAYLARLRKKGNKPITGDDLDRAMTEIMTIMKSIQYTEEGGDFTKSNMMLDYFNGDEQAFRNYVRYQVIPKYVRIFPPYINFKGIINKLGEANTIMEAYKTDAEFKRQALKEQSGNVTNNANINASNDGNMSANTLKKRVVQDIQSASKSLRGSKSINKSNELSLKPII